VLATLDASASPAPITNGNDDAGDPAVVALLATTDHASCTGTLVSSRVVVTAGHCVNRPGFDVFFGSTAGSGGELVRVIDARAHPSFVSTTLAYDVGVLLLERDATVAPLPMWTGAIDARLVGSSLRLVGFGAASGQIDPSQKRFGTSMITELSDQKLTVVPGPSTACTGDSGGPGLVSDGTSEAIAGVISSADTECTQFSRLARIDLARTDFVEPYIERTRPGSQPIGAICYYGDNCATATCVEAADDPALQYCSGACAGSSDCPSSMHCEHGMCTYSTPTPGSLGTSCDSALDCGSNICIASAEGEPTICSRRCALDSQCGDGFACDRGPQSDFGYCFAVPGGCCAATSNGGGSALLLGLLVGSRLRRRRRSAREQPGESRADTLGTARGRNGEALE